MFLLSGFTRICVANSQRAYDGKGDAAASSNARLGAAGAHPEDREVPDVDRESVLGGHSYNRRFKNSRGHFGYSPTFPTDEMKVVGIVRGVVGRRTVAEVSVRDQAKLLEQLEGPVDGRDVNARCGNPDPLGDLVRRRMSERGDRLEDELALRSQPVTASAQVFMPRRRRAIHH